MKAVVVAIKDGRAAVLEQGGGMRHIKDADYQIGQILALADPVALPEGAAEGGAGEPVDFQARARRFVARYGAGIAAALGLVAVAGGVTAYAAPIATVKVETLPTLEYRVNVFDRVVGFSATEDTGSTQALREHLRGRKLEDAIVETIAVMDGGLSVESESDDAPAVTVTVTSAFTTKQTKLKVAAESGIGSLAQPQSADAPASGAQEAPAVQEDAGTQAPAASDAEQTPAPAKPEKDTSKKKVSEEGTPPTMPAQEDETAGEAGTTEDTSSDASSEQTGQQESAPSQKSNNAGAGKSSTEESASEAPADESAQEGSGQQETSAESGEVVSDGGEAAPVDLSPAPEEAGAPGDSDAGGGDSSAGASASDAVAATGSEGSTGAEATESGATAGSTLVSDGSDASGSGAGTESAAQELEGGADGAASASGGAEASTNSVGDAASWALKETDA